MTHREATIQQLLERYEDLSDPKAAGNGGDSFGVRHMPHERRCLLLTKEGDQRKYGRRCTCAYQHVVELERLLRLMRDDRSHPLLTLPCGEKTSVRACWWHLNARYITCTHVSRNVSVRRKTKHGKRLTVTERQLIAVVNGAAVRIGDDGLEQLHPKVERGIEWLAQAWALRIEPKLPGEFRVAA